MNSPDTTSTGASATAASPPPGRWDRARGLLADLVYPPSTASERQGGTVRRLLTGGAVVLIAALAALLRLPIKDLDTLWAEDGTAFLQVALHGPATETIPQPHSGYLQVFPRIVAEVLTLLPVSAAGVAFSVVAALVVGLAAWTVWELGAAQLPSPWLRGLLAAAVVVIPAGGLEAADNVANSHWYLMYAAFWALVARRPGAGRQVLPVVIVVLAALSDPLSIVLAPLALGRLVLLRGWRDRWVVIAYVVAIAVQLHAVLSVERATGQTAAPRDIVFGYALRVVLSSLTGNGGARRIVDGMGSTGVWLVAGLALVCLLVGWALAGRFRLFIAASAVASMGFFVVECLFALGGQYPPTGDLQSDLTVGGRYTIVPALLLLTAFAVAAQAVSARLTGRVALLGAAVVAVPLVLCVASDYRPEGGSLRTGAPSWSDEVEQAEEECATSAGATPDPVPIAPAGAWTVALDCRDLADG